jgi:hypothetical protein
MGAEKAIAHCCGVLNCTQHVSHPMTLDDLHYKKSKYTSMGAYGESFLLYNIYAQGSEEAMKILKSVPERHALVFANLHTWL